MFFKGRRPAGSSMNIIVGSFIGVVSGYHLFHDIFGQRGEKLIEYNKKLKEEITNKQSQENKE